jgi:hypothetical protein
MTYRDRIFFCFPETESRHSTCLPDPSLLVKQSFRPGVPDCFSCVSFMARHCWYSSQPHGC